MRYTCCNGFCTQKQRKKGSDHMTTAKKHDWGLIAVGIILIICAFVLGWYPGITLVTITAFFGLGLLLSGIFDIMGYVGLARLGNPSGWVVAYAVLDIILGAMLLFHPVVLSGVVPWLVGIFVIVFGAFEITGAFKLKQTGARSWGWMVFSGIVDILCGFVFFVMPEMLAIFLAVFIIMRGLSLVIYGWNRQTFLL